MQNVEKKFFTSKKVGEIYTKNLHHWVSLSNKMLQQQCTSISKLRLVARKSLHEWISCNHWVLHLVGDCVLGIYLTNTI